MGRPCEVDEIFDKISYNKGASIIRMLYDWIGNQCFRMGMSQYLTKYAYKVHIKEIFPVKLYHIGLVYLTTKLILNLLDF